MKKNKIKPQNLIERFTPTVQSGLSAVQVKSRINDGLINENPKKYSKSYLNIFIENTFTFFNLLGLIVFIALLYAEAPLLNFVFVLVYLLNIVIGVSQEIRAKKCIDKLSLLSSNKCTVIRDGNLMEISPTNIVLDDIIKLTIGNQVPTDCIILDGNIEVDESVLTGESVNVKKKSGDLLLSGSVLVAGSCTVQAERVGKDNYVQKLSAQAKKYKKPHSELMSSLGIMIKSLGFIIIPFAFAFMIKTTLIGKIQFNDAVLSTSTLIIGMIPSGMFLLTSLALAVGIIKLAAHNTLVQDLYSLEMLARVDTICFDKTGTITDGNMNVKEIVPLKSDLSLNTIKSVISSMVGTLQDTNQTALALKRFAGNKIILNAVNSLPFNSKRKLSAVEFTDSGTFSIGAPEFVLSKDTYAMIEKEITTYASLGLRVLMLANSAGSINDGEVPQDFVPYALILLEDNIRKDAKSTVKWFKDNGVAVKVISGDNPVTVSEVSKRVGILNAENYISLEGLSDEEVADAADKYTVFGRVSPEQKAILIRSMKKSGHTTAMTGDGVNDILALKEADCAVSVASGSDAARNVAHIVLLDNNFNSMPNVVFEGRRVINNVQSAASLYLMKTFFTLLIAFVTLVIPVTTKYPFDLRQMNLLEIIIIGIPSFFLSLQPNKMRVEGKFLHYVVKKSFPGAYLMALSVGAVRLFGLIAGGIYSEELYQTLSVYALTFSGLINLVVICYPFNKFRISLLSFTTALLIAVFLTTVFHGIPMLGFSSFVPLSKNYMLILVLIGIVILDVPLSIFLQKSFERLFKIKK